MSTEPITFDEAVDSLLMPEQAEETQSEEPETEDEEAPVEDQQTDADEVEAEADDADDSSEDDPVEEDEDDDQEDEEVEELADTHTVTVDGKEVQVTLEDLKRGYSGQAYIQKGMKTNAETQKKAEQAFYALQAERAQLAQLTQQIQAGGFIPEPKMPDPETAQTDPIGWIEQNAAYTQQKAQYDAQQMQLQQVHAQQTAAQQQARQAYLSQQAQALKEFIPEMADADKAGEIRDAIRSVGVEHYGFTEEELGAVTDARHVRVLNDARKWRELQANKKAKTKQAVKKSRPAIKASAKVKTDPKRKERDAQRKRLKQSGSLQDAVSLIME
jgi:hypothetical protein